VSLVDALHLPVAALEYRYATEHDNGQSAGDIILITTIANGSEDRPVQEVGRTMYVLNDTSRSPEIHRRHSGRKSKNGIKRHDLNGWAYSVGRYYDDGWREL